MSWEKVKIGELFYDKMGRLCRKYSKTEFDLEPRRSEGFYTRVKGSQTYDFGSYYKKMMVKEFKWEEVTPMALSFTPENKKEYVTVHFPKKGDTRVLNIYRTREAALLGALADKNAGKQGHIAVLAIEVKE